MTPPTTSTGLPPWVPDSSTKHRYKCAPARLRVRAPPNVEPETFAKVFTVTTRASLEHIRDARNRWGHSDEISAIQASRNGLGIDTKRSSAFGRHHRPLPGGRGRDIARSTLGFLDRQVATCARVPDRPNLAGSCEFAENSAGCCARELLART